MTATDRLLNWLYRLLGHSPMATDERYFQLLQPSVVIYARDGFNWGHTKQKIVDAFPDIKPQTMQRLRETFTAEQCLLNIKTCEACKKAMTPSIEMH